MMTLYNQLSSDRFFADRVIMHCTLRDTPGFQYELPALTAEELAHIRALEVTLRRARYAERATVLIYWDTETTTFAPDIWWRNNTSRIVQIAAHTTAEFGGRELELRANPWPSVMEEGATRATGMSTEDVHAHELPPQVRMLLGNVAPCRT
jgi:hypothetical protein